MVCAVISFIAGVAADVVGDYFVTGTLSDVLVYISIPMYIVFGLLLVWHLGAKRGDDVTLENCD
jgi:hypothetical protein